jgi:hypothetical protein
MSQDAFPRKERLLRLLSRGFDGAADRRQQSNAIREHDLESTEPRAPCPEVALMARRVGRLAPREATLPGFIGLGASSAFGRRGAADTISRVRRGDPNPLCPDTSLRELVVLPAGDSGIPGDCAARSRLAFASEDRCRPHTFYEPIGVGAIKPLTREPAFAKLAAGLPAFARSPAP